MAADGAGDFCFEDVYAGAADGDGGPDCDAAVPPTILSPGGVSRRSTPQRQRSVTFDGDGAPGADAAAGQGGDTTPSSYAGSSSNGAFERARQTSAERKQVGEALNEFRASEQTLLRRQNSLDSAPSRSRADSEESLEDRVSPEDFTLLKVIGQGAYGRVFQVRHAQSGAIFAMKVLAKGQILEKNNLSYVLEERNILSKARHPFVVSLMCAFQTPAKLYLVMEYVCGGELFSHLRDEGLFEEPQARFYFAEMLLAIEYLHQNGIIHRDLKPENVLLDAHGHIRITDFGLATENRKEARTLCGTDLYMAPEMIAGHGYGKAVDFWSLGAILFEMLTGDTPFYAKDTRRLYRLILTSKPKFPRWLSRDCIALLRGLLNRNVAQRLGATESTMFKVGGVQALKSHEFLSGVDWNAMGRLEVAPPFVPPLSDGEADTSNFSDKFTQLAPDALHNEPDSEEAAACLASASKDDFAGFSFTHPSYLSAAMVSAAIGSHKGDSVVAAVAAAAAASASAGAPEATEAAVSAGLLGPSGGAVPWAGSAGLDAGEAEAEGAAAGGLGQGAQGVVVAGAIDAPEAAEAARQQAAVARGAEESGGAEVAAAGASFALNPQAREWVPPWA